MHTAVQTFQIFVIMGIAKLHGKMTCIHANIMKNSDQNFIFMQNFMQKKIIFFKSMRNFEQNCFCIDRKVQKSHFMQNHPIFVQEN